MNNKSSDGGLLLCCFSQVSTKRSQENTTPISQATRFCILHLKTTRCLEINASKKICSRTLAVAGETAVFSGPDLPRWCVDTQPEAGFDVHLVNVRPIAPHSPTDGTIVALIFGIRAVTEEASRKG